MMIALWAVLLIAVSADASGARETISVPAGVFAPFFKDEGEKDHLIGGLEIDRYPVTNRQFLEFVREHPSWSRSRVKSLFAGAGYLEHWSGGGELGPDQGELPVTNVSWFAARAYCGARGKRLLTTAEWEYASDAQEPASLTRILEWYGRKDALVPVRKAATNGRGLVGMHGLIWEWVEDFSSAIVADDSRSSNETSRSMFCGSGSLKAKDPAQYATFMRYAHRSSLRADSVGRALGFRCARDAKPAPAGVPKSVLKKESP